MCKFCIKAEIPVELCCSFRPLDLKLKHLFLIIEYLKSDLGRDCSITVRHHEVVTSIHFVKIRTFFFTKPFRFKPWLAGPTPLHTDLTNRISKFQTLK